MAVMNQSSGPVKVHCGQVLVAGYKSCEIIHNDDIINYTGPDESVIQGLKFGLISYRCEHAAGYVISPFGCKNCNFSCYQEQTISRCHQDEVQFWSGLVFAVFLTTIICGIFYKFIIKSANSPALNTRSFQLKFSKTPQGSNENVAVSIDENDYEILEYAFEPKSQKNDTESQEDMVKSQEERKSIKSPQSKKKSFSTFIAGLLFTKTVIACDWTVLMASNKLMTICNSTACLDTPPYSFSPLLRQEICFEDFNNSHTFLSLTISEITVRARYKFMYDAFDYDVINQTFLSSAFLYDDGGDCSTVLPECKETRLAMARGSLLSLPKTMEQGESCPAKKILFSTGYACYRYFWEIEKTEPYPIFSKVGEIWTAKLIFNWRNYTRAIKIIDATDPLFNLFGFESSTVDKIPINILNTEVKTTRLVEHLVLIDEKFYMLNTTVVNGRNSVSLGNFEILTKSHEDGAKFRLPSPEGNFPDKCCYDTSNCTCDWHYHDRNIKKILTELEGPEYLDNFILRKNDRSVVDLFERVNSGRVTLRIDDSKSNTTTNGKCDIKHVLSYGSTSRDESSYLVLTSHDVESEGLVPFYSNCTFDKVYVKCDQYEPTKLTLKEKYNTCLFKIPTLKKTLLINMQYYDIDQFTKREEENSPEPFSETLVCLATSGMFLKTVLISMSLLFSSILILIIGYRIFLKRSNKFETTNKATLLEFKSNITCQSNET